MTHTPGATETEEDPRAKEIIYLAENLGAEFDWQETEIRRLEAINADLLAMLKDHLDGFSGDGYDMSDTAEIIAKATLAKPE